MNATLLSPQVPDVNASQFVYGYGSERAGPTVVGHNGGESGVATEMVSCPEAGVGAEAVE